MTKKNFHQAGTGEELMRNRVRIFRKKVERNLSKVEDCDPSVAIFRAAMGESECCELLLASDLRARSEAGRTLAALLKGMSSNGPGRTFYFGTCIDDVGNTSDRAPIAQIKALKDKAYRTLKAAGFNAIVVIEAQPLMNFPRQGKGRTIMIHVHFIAWCDPGQDAEAKAAFLASSGAWRCSIGAEPVKLEEVGSTPEDLERVAFYMVKPPHSAKNLTPRKKRPGQMRLMDTIKGYRPDLAVRMLEFLSQVELLDLFFGVGEGRKLRQDVRAHMVEWHQARTKNGVAVDRSVDIWKAWLDFRARKANSRYLPFRFIGLGGIVPRETRIKLVKARKRNVMPPRAFQKAMKARAKRAMKYRRQRD